MAFGNVMTMMRRSGRGKIRRGAAIFTAREIANQGPLVLKRIHGGAVEFNAGQFIQPIIGDCWSRSIWLRSWIRDASSALDGPWIT